MSEGLRRSWPGSPTGRSGVVALASLVVGASGCAPAFRQPSVRVLSVAVSDFRLSGATATLEMEVGNPNDRELRLRGIRYSVSVADARDGADWHELAKDERGWRVVIPAGDTIGVELDIPFRYGGAGVALGSLLRQGEVRYRLSGEIRAEGPLGEIAVPVRRTGTFRSGDG